MRFEENPSSGQMLRSVTAEHWISRIYAALGTELLLFVIFLFVLSPGEEKLFLLHQALVKIEFQENGFKMEGCDAPETHLYI